MSHTYTNIELIYDLETIESHIDKLFSDMKDDKKLEQFTFIVVKLHTQNTSELCDILPPVLTNLIIEYEGDELTHTVDYFKNTRKQNLYNVTISTDISDIFFDYNDKKITRMGIDNQNISSEDMKISSEDMKISSKDMKCLKYIIDNNINIVSLPEDDVYSTCSHICKQVLKYDSCGDFFSLIHNIIKSHSYVDLITMCMFHHILSNKLKNIN